MDWRTERDVSECSGVIFMKTGTHPAFDVSPLQPILHIDNSMILLKLNLMITSV